MLRSWQDLAMALDLRRPPSLTKRYLEGEWLEWHPSQLLYHQNHNIQVALNLPFQILSGKIQAVSIVCSGRASSPDWLFLLFHAFVNSVIILATSWSEMCTCVVPPLYTCGSSSYPPHPRLIS